MNEDFVTFKQAKTLKKLGFGLKTYAFYNKEGNLYSSDNPDYWNDEIWHEFSAPTLAQVQKWLREELGIEINSSYDMIAKNGWFYYCNDLSKDIWKEGFNILANEKFYSTYEQALSAGLDKVLELIK